MKDLLAGVMVGVLLVFFASAFTGDGGDLTQLIGAVFDDTVRAALPYEMVTSATAFAAVGVLVIGIIIGVIGIDDEMGVIPAALFAAVLFLLTIGVLGKVGIILIVSFIVGIVYGHKAGLPALVGIAAGAVLAVAGGGMLLAAAAVA